MSNPLAILEDPGAEARDAARRGCRVGAGSLVSVSIADQLFEERRLRRRAGDPRLSDEGRAVLRRITTGDLADEFGKSLEEISDADPLLSGTDDHD